MRKCAACGNIVEEIHYQSRAADEAHTTIWSCNNCPLDASKISLSRPKSEPFHSFPRDYHRRQRSLPYLARDPQPHRSLHVEADLPVSTETTTNTGFEPHIRSPCAIPGPSGVTLIRGYKYTTGEFSGKTVVEKSRIELAPRVYLVTSDTYYSTNDNTLYAEQDGRVKFVRGNTTPYFMHTRDIGGREKKSVVVPVKNGTQAEIRRSICEVLELVVPWESMRSLLGNAVFAAVSNLSPRAWDVTTAPQKGHVYTQKIDGERAYIIIYSRIAYMFRKGGATPRIQWQVLDSTIPRKSALILDVENTISHGCFVIDMLTDRDGKLSPPDRGLMWVLQEFGTVRDFILPVKVHVRRYYRTLTAATRESLAFLCPTDGVIAMPATSTSAKKIKRDKSVELRVGEDMSLCTSDGSVVIQKMPLYQNATVGDIAEVRFVLLKTGKSINIKDVFKRPDKTEPNSSSAVSSILRCFAGVSREEESGRRTALMWCNSLCSTLLDIGLKQSETKSIVLDIGTGTGQSLDNLTLDKNVSYILVEPDPERCEMIRRRARVATVSKDPRVLLASLRSLKSRSIGYVILNCGIEDILKDDELCYILMPEIKVATCFFSASYVVPSLYALSLYWLVPILGCTYPYDGVEVGGRLVNSLGVEMKRTSDTECSVRWGGDKAYIEPYATMQSYGQFCTVQPASNYLQYPDSQAGDGIPEICSKVYVVSSVS